MKSRSKLRILHLISTLGAGGAENHLFLLAREQKREGHQVEVGYFRSSGNLQEAFEKEGIAVHYLRGTHYLSGRVLYFLSKLIFFYRPQVIHTHLFSGDLYGVLLGRLFGVKAIISSKHNQDQYLKKNGFKQLGRAIIALDSQVLAISEAVKEFTYKSIGYSKRQAARKFTRIYYGIDLQEIDQTPKETFSRKAYGIPEDALILGTIGRLSEQKGYPYLIEAFARLQEEFPFLYLIAVGRGEQEKEIREEIKKKNLEKNFLLVGYHSERSKLLGFLQAMDIFVLPSLWEGFGLVLAEAMALRKPIVASSAGSIPEVISEECGRLVAPKDVDGLFNCLKEIILDPELRDQMGNAGRKRVEGLFSLKPMVRNTEALYKKYL